MKLKDCTCDTTGELSLILQQIHVHRLEYL